MIKDPVSDKASCGSGRVLHNADSATSWHRLEQSIMEARQRFGSLPANELQAIIDEAVTMSRQAL